jgi:hypothetical protein
MLGIEDIENAVREAARAQFPNSGVRVSVARDTDSDGDAIFRIIVVLPSAEAPTGNEVLSLADRIVIRLRDMEADGFPLISLMSQREAKQLRLETA